MPTNYEGTCVGGPWARRHVAARTPLLTVPADPPGYFRGALTPPRTARHDYRHVQLWHGIGLWVHESLTIPDALAILVSEYQKGTP